MEGWMVDNGVAEVRADPSSDAGILIRVEDTDVVCEVWELAESSAAVSETWLLTMNFPSFALQHSALFCPQQ